ncbi:hypothetical protein I317_07359 [Kwoniella heveanensis CBS 569]|nr:hypothetical protein I317_07359 [Kwoniella heveanensis CBS 569]
MGVRGLESFIKENRTSLCRTISLSASDHSEDRERTPVIVDAWGIVFKLYLDSLPWTSGGEYLRYYQAVKRLVTAWRRVGLEPIFVFDGPAPAEKHDTLVQRGQEKIVACQLFYTTSVTSRSAPSFSRQSGGVVLPFFASHAFILALHRLDVKTHFVPQGEADGVCVVMADKIGGYVLGRDSDFPVLVGRTERCKGYVPLNMINWIEGEIVIPPTPASSFAPSQDGKYRPSGMRSSVANQQSFQPVQNGRRNQPYHPDHRQSSLLPSPSFKNPTLVLTIIPPQALRHRLRLPATHLPLFASLCGTDYTPPSITQQFFEPSLSVVQRIEKAARVLREQLYSPSNQLSSGGGKSGTFTPNPADQVVQLVKKVVKKLCIYPFDTEQALDETVDIVIEAALQYQLPHSGVCCSVYPFCGELDPMGCQTPVNMPGDGFIDDAVPPVTPPSSGSDYKKKAKEAYAEARRRGLLSSINHGWLSPDRVYLWHVLEDPSGPNWKGTEGSRGIRSAAWGIAEEGLGGLRWQEEEEEEEEENHDASGREAVQTEAVPSPAARLVAEEGADQDSKTEDKALRHLLGVDQSETNSEAGGVQSEGTTLVDADITLNHASFSDPAKDPVRAITEWSRQGSSKRIGPSSLPLPPLRNIGYDDPPPCLRPLDERLRLYLVPLYSDTPAIIALPISIQPLVATIRFCVIDASKRVSNKTDVHMWRRDETAAILRASLGTYSLWLKEFRSEGSYKNQKDPEEAKALGEGGGRNWPLLETRNSVLIAHLGSVWADAHTLAQALLLMPSIASPPKRGSTSVDSDDWSDIGLTHIAPYVFYGGINLHLLLSKIEPSAGTGWTWGSNEQGMFDRCWAALIDGLEDGVIVGLKREMASTGSNGSAHNTAGLQADESVAEEKQKKSKKNKNKRKSHEKSQDDLLLASPSATKGGAKGKGQGKNLIQSKGGRFDLLDGLAM